MTRKIFDYLPGEIESKWQTKWRDAKLFDVDFDPKKPKKYCLEMFPYPSGRIHMGHVRNYSIGDVMSRFFRMRGYNVLHPMGWDAFGLPAENAAIQNKVHPKKWTYDNIANMKSQFSRLGVSFDWRREVTTCEPDYYKWEQLMFLKMLSEGLAYREKRNLNWCPSCETVLANEEVVDGLCWRCDSQVVLKEMDQWFLRITKYAEELLEDIKTELTQWPDRVRTMQEYWIGKSVGAEIDFGFDVNAPVELRSEIIRVFTTRPDTLFGATAVILAPEHALVTKLVAGKPQEKEIRAFIEKIRKQDRMERASETAEKLGMFTGAFTVHPLTKEKIPIWIANFVLTDYGTGALMAVPGHDTRDFAFATKYNIPIKRVVQKIKGEETELPFCEDGFSVNSPDLDGLSTSEAKKKITDILVRKKIGAAKTNFRLRDWGISRQRYWGAPIPIIYCPKDGAVPVPEKDLPVKLPDDVQFQDRGKGGSPLAHDEKFLNVKCPKCGEPAKREADTMATFVESSWYYARYCAVKNEGAAVSKKDCDHWLPIDHYIGGVEHATGHLLYFRFFHKLMRDWGWVSGDEPAKQLICQGMVYKDGAKMSKSKGNVVDPDELIAKFGADTARMFVLFAGPIEKDLEWSDKGVEGCYRFLGRVFRLVMNSLEELQGIDAKAKVEAESAAGKELEHLLNKTIKNVTVDIEKDFHYNTAISFMMELVNHLYSIDLKKAETDTRLLFRKTLDGLVLMLSPFAPHMTDELWVELGHEGFTLNASWPAFDEAKARSSTREIVLQINGKIKDRIQCADGMANDKLQELALANAKITAALGGQTPKKVIVVPNKLVNVVI